MGRMKWTARKKTLASGKTITVYEAKGGKYAIESRCVETRQPETGDRIVKGYTYYLVARGKRELFLSLKEAKVKAEELEAEERGRADEPDQGRSDKAD